MNDVYSTHKRSLFSIYHKGRCVWSMNEYLCLYIYMYIHVICTSTHVPASSYSLLIALRTTLARGRIATGSMRVMRMRMMSEGDDSDDGDDDDDYDSAEASGHRHSTP